MKNMFAAVAILLICNVYASADDALAKSDEPIVLLFEPQLFAASTECLPTSFVRAVGFEQGEIGGVTSAWTCASHYQPGAGKLWMDIDRTRLDEDLAMTLLYERDLSADVAVQLWDAQGRVVALDLFKNVLSVATQANTGTFIIPLRKYPSASRIMFRRLSGAVKLYGVILKPVVSEEPLELDLLMEISKMFGDPLSPENPVFSRVRAVAAAEEVRKVDAVRLQTSTALSNNAGTWSPPERHNVLAKLPEDKNRARLHNKKVLGSDGKGKILEFDGQNDFVEIEADSSLKISGEITLLAKFRLDAGASGATHYMLIDKMGFNPYEGYRVYAVKDGFNDPVDGKVSVFFALDLGGDGTGDVHLCAPNSVKLGETNHVAAVYDGKAMKIYLNGTIAAEAPASGAIVSGKAPLYIGRNAYGWHWKGMIGDLDVLGRALSVEEVAARVK